MSWIPDDPAVPRAPRCLSFRGGPASLLFASTLAALVCALLLQPGCQRANPQQGGPRGEAAPVLAAKAVRQDVPVTLRAIGRAEAYRTVAVRARIGGTLVRVHFKEGQDVQQGQLLFTIDPAPYQVALKQAEADLAAEQARATAAALDARRSAELLKKDLVSDSDHERLAAASAAESAAVRSQQARVENARLNLGYCSIQAPIAGRTSNLMVDQGNLVKANDDALVVINQLTPIYVSFSIPERSLPEVLQRSKEDELPVEAQPAGATGESSRGKLTFINNAVDPATGTILLKAEFPNEERNLWPDQFAQVTVILATRMGAVVVPTSAVQTGQKGDYVLVIKPDLTTEMRSVTSGPRLDGNAIIDSGLEPGETVVTDGQLRVTPGAKVVIRSQLGGGGPAEAAQGPSAGGSGAQLEEGGGAQPAANAGESSTGGAVRTTTK